VRARCGQRVRAEGGAPGGKRGRGLLAAGGEPAPGQRQRLGQHRHRIGETPGDVVLVDLHHAQGHLGNRIRRGGDAFRVQRFGVLEIAGEVFGFRQFAIQLPGLFRVLLPGIGGQQRLALSEHGDRSRQRRGRFRAHAATQVQRQQLLLKITEQLPLE